MSGVESEHYSTLFTQVDPVCVAIGGRAGVGKSTLLDALAGRLAGLGPLTIGELAPCNDPARTGAQPGTDVPIDIAIHLLSRTLLDSDRRAIAALRARGIPVLGVLARADLVPDRWAVAAGCAELALLPVGLGPETDGLAELVDCLSVGIGEILAGRADRLLAAADRRAIEAGADGGARDQIERLLIGPSARRLRLAGAASWDRCGGSPRAALAEAARWRARANEARDPGEAARARDWHRRYVARAVELTHATGHAA